MSPERFRELGIDPNKRDYSIEDVLEIAIRAGQHAGHRAAIDASAIQADRDQPLFLTEERVQKIVEASMAKAMTAHREELRKAGINLDEPGPLYAKLTRALNTPDKAYALGYEFVKGVLTAAGAGFLGWLVAKGGKL